MATGRRQSQKPGSGADQDQTAVKRLRATQLETLHEGFKAWFEASPNDYLRRVRGRYWITFLALRFTGARIGEVLNLDDSRDVDFRNREIQILIEGSHDNRSRVIPVPYEFVAQIATYLAEFPSMRGKVFGLDQGNFRRKYYDRAREASIPKDLSHPHVLRHTRAIEMINAGVPLTIVQELLGHSVIAITAKYLRRRSPSPKSVLADKGLL